MTKFKELNSKLDNTGNTQSEIIYKYRVINKPSIIINDNYREQLRADAQRVTDKLKADNNDTIRIVKTIHRTLNVLLTIAIIAWVGFGLYLLTIKL